MSSKELPSQLMPFDFAINIESISFEICILLFLDFLYFLSNILKRLSWVHYMLNSKGMKILTL